MHDTVNHVLAETLLCVDDVENTVFDKRYS